MKRHAVNLSLLVVAVLAMFWRVFLLGETLVDVNTLNNQLPWGYQAGPSDYPYNRRDLTDTYVTRDYFVVQAYRDGEFPLWNPYTMAGHPIYADGVTRTLSPFLLIYKFFDVPLGYSLARITELMLAAVFMYIFLIAIGVAPRGALIGALVFEFSAHSMLHLTGLGWWGGLMWLPLVMLFVDRAARRGSVNDAAVAGVLLAFQFFCGYLPNQIYYAGAIGLYYLTWWWVCRRSVRQQVRLARTLALAAVTLTVGLALAATQWVPSLELLGYSNRKIVGAELSYVYLPPWYALTLIFPTIFGSAYDVRTLTLFNGIGVSHDHILYIGVAALAPAVFAIWWLRWRRPGSSYDNSPDSNAEPLNEPAARRIRLFAVLVLLSALTMMATPLYVVVTRFIPVLQVIRVAVRAGVLFLFAASALSGLGVELLFAANEDLLGRMFRAVRRLTVWATLVAAAGTVTAVALRSTGFASEQIGHGKIAFLRRAAAVLSPQFLSPDRALLLPLLLLSAVTLIVWLMLKRRLNSRIAFAFLVVLLVGDLFWNSGQFDHSFDRSRVYPRTELTDLLKSLPPGRVLVVPSDLDSNRKVASRDSTGKIIAPPNTLLPYRIPVVSGKNQQFPRWYREYASLIEPQTNLSHVVFDKAQSPFFDLLNVRYVLTHAGTSLEDYELLATLEGIAVYENKRALPRAFFASRILAAASPAQSLDLMRGEPDFGRTAVLENAKIDEGSFTVGEASILEDKRNRITVETAGEGKGLLVLSDNYYAGWRASVDGAPADVLRANRTMRAVIVPAGKHVVSFEFRPASFLISVYVSLSAAAVLLIFFGVAAFRRSRVKQE